MHQRLRRGGYGYLKQRITAFNQLSQRVMPVLLLTDLDDSRCPAELISAWLPGGASPRLLFLVAVREMESWLLADRLAFADVLGILIDKSAGQTAETK